MVDEERALTLLQKAEYDELDAKETRWLAHWLRAQEGHWLQSLLRADSFRHRAPESLRCRVRLALAKGRSPL